MSRELLPCPFCGASAKMMKPVESTQGQRDAGYGSRQYGVACGADLKCEAHVSGFPTSATAREAWNTRAPVSVANDPRVVEALNKVMTFLESDDWGNYWYMEGEAVYEDIADMKQVVRAALANLEKKDV